MAQGVDPYVKRHLVRESAKGMIHALKRIATATACHAAVEANYPLARQKMIHFLDGLRRRAYSTICPDGRPVMMRLTRRELERRFERI